MSQTKATTKGGTKGKAGGRKRGNTEKSAAKKSAPPHVPERLLVKGKYEPTAFTEAELATLREIGMRGGNPRDDVAHAEVARVARNIAVTLSDPETDEEVREAVEMYVYRVCSQTLRNYVHFPAVIRALFPVACVAISEVPFVPSKPVIEALTGTDKDIARMAARSLGKDGYEV
jgi:hypothetical protein